MLRDQKKTKVEYECEYSIVFCTKYQKEILVENVRQVLENQIRIFFTQKGLGLKQLQIGANYVYLIVEIDPQLSVNQVVRRLKIETSTVLRQEFKKLTKVLPSIWTFNYWCSTKGPFTEALISEYVEAQPTR